MDQAVERFVAAARRGGVEVAPRRYPQGTRTAMDAAAAIGCDLAQIVKSLLFVASDGTPVLALTSGSSRVDPARLATAAGTAQARLATPDEVREHTGYSVGGTPPFGHRRAIATVADRDLLAFDVVWAAAGTPDACFPIAPAELVGASGATVARIGEGDGAADGD